MHVMNWGRKNLPSSAALCPHYYTSLQELLYRTAIFPSSLTQRGRSTLMDQMDGRPAPSTLYLSLSPLTLLRFLFLFFFLFLSHSVHFSPLPSHIFSKSCFRLFGSAVHKSFVISLWCSLDRLRQPVVWFSFNLIFVQSDTLYVSASVSCTQSGRSEFSSQPWTSLFMRENGIKSVHYRLQYFWPGTLFSLAVALKVCWNGPFFHVYKWALFMNPQGNGCFLKGFKRIAYSVRGPRFVNHIHTLHHIETNMVWLCSPNMNCHDIYQNGLPKCCRCEQLEWWREELVNCFPSPKTNDWKREQGSSRSVQRWKTAEKTESKTIRCLLICLPVVDLKMPSSTKCAINKNKNE